MSPRDDAMALDDDCFRSRSRDDDISSLALLVL